MHIAEASLKALVQAEMGLFDGDVPRPSSSFLQSRNSSEPGACRLVRTACKAFARGADEKSGCHGPFSSFVKPVLKQYRMHSLPLTPYRGSRFNILFENASYMFFFHDQMILYLEGNNTNALLKAVLEDLKTPKFVAGCKALGLISCLITTSLWRMIEDKTINIVDMNGKSTKLKRDVFEELLKPWADDDTGEIILKVVLPAIAMVFQHLFSDLLQGGKHANIDEAGRNALAGTPKHNKFSESVFGFMDQLVRSKPNISTLSAEAYVMFANNKTNAWLEERP